MSLSRADLLVLKAELANDPLHLGLVNDAAHDEANANLLNEVRDSIQVYKTSLAVSDVFGAINVNEMLALSASQKGWVDTFMTLGQINPFANGNTTNGFAVIFGNNSQTLPAVQALFKTAGSRITQLFQAGTISDGSDVTPSDIANARNAT